MFAECRHILTGGKKCEAPALKGAAFCYYHSRLHAHSRRGLRAIDSLDIPDLEDRCSIQFVITQVLRLLAGGKIDQPRAHTLLYGLQLALQAVDRKRMAIHPRDTVCELSRSADGDELGPAEITCDEDESCLQCPYAKTCPNYNPHKTGDGEEDGEVTPAELLASLRTLNSG